MALTLAMPSMSQAVDDDGDVVAVVNPANPVEELSIHDLRLLYGLYKRTWQGGLRVRLLLPSEGAAISFLTTEVLRMAYATDVDRFYLQAVFQQRVPSRPSQHPGRAALARVRAEPGAIALVERREVQDPEGLRVLEIRRD